MAYKIECYVETISSDGMVTVRGVDGYRLERDGKAYNVFWEMSQTDDKSKTDDKAEEEILTKVFHAEKALKWNKEPENKEPENKEQKNSYGENFQLLLTAKASRLKALLEVEDDMSVQKVSLI